MRNFIQLACALLASALLSSGVALAQMTDVEFSATMIQTMPKNETMTSRVYMGKNVMRTETTQQGKARITIVDHNRQTAWMLNPAKREYVEMKGPQSAPAARGAGIRPPLPDEPGSPCKQQKGLECKKLGTESMAGRSTDVWEFVASQGERTTTSKIWIDKELRMPIRQELPGGMVSEIRDIKVGPQPASLFQVPRGYKKIDMPGRPMPKDHER